VNNLAEAELSMLASLASDGPGNGLKLINGILSVTLDNLPLLEAVPGVRGL
jgi:hypothetical protein